MSGELELVYDAAREWPPLWFPALGLVGVGFGVLVWYTRRSSVWARPRDPTLRTVLAGFILGFAILWTAATSISVLAQDWAARRALRTGTARVVEGTVRDFHPMRGGHDSERFTVDGVRFVYPEIGPGFGKTVQDGGPIREGLYVRIHYTGARDHATILRLEIRR